MGRKHPQEGPRHRLALQHLPKGEPATGPLASPGRAALLAVLSPAETKELYFVSRNDGTHAFSETLEEHNRAVERDQRLRRSR